MVKTDPKKVMEAIHGLIVEAKMMAGYQKKHEDMYRFLDELEFLPTLVIDEEDKTEIFNDYLKDICEDFNCIRIYTKYSKANT